MSSNHRNKFNKFNKNNQTSNPTTVVPNKYDKNEILSNFPKIELSYETTVHKKVQSDFMSAIPIGPKCFAWFTVFEDENVCFLMESMQARTQIVSIAPALTSFESSLCADEYGTIVYGSVINNSSTRFFVFEDIFYYKGRNTRDISYVEKLQLFSFMMSYELGKYAFNNNCVIFGLPVIHNIFEDFLELVKALPYKIARIRFHNINNNNQVCSISYFYYMNGSQTQPIGANHNPQSATPTATQMTNKNKNNINKQVPTVQTKIFKVRPNTQPDVYQLYDKDDIDCKKAFEIAYIPNYSTSVMMNNLFRNIKENANLDALEESDDEEEFENNNIEKFVFLDKSYYMSCVYNIKFKKWVPQKVVEHV